MNLQITGLRIDAHIKKPGSRGGKIIGYRKGEPIYGKKVTAKGTKPKAYKPPPVKPEWTSEDSDTWAVKKHIEEMLLGGEKRGLSDRVHYRFTNSESDESHIVWILRDVRKAVLSAYKSNSPMPKNLTFAQDVNMEKWGLKSYGGFFDSAEGITINVDANKSLKEVMHHEMGHAQHFAKLKSEGNDAKTATDIMSRKVGRLDPKDNLILLDIAREVSRYATTNQGEFVAEVHKGLRSGRKYSDRISQLFEKAVGTTVKEWTKNWS